MSSEIIQPKIRKYGQIINGFMRVFLRFPLPVICMLASFICAVISIHLSKDVKSIALLACFTFSFGAPFFAALRIWCEAKNLKRRYDMMIGIPLYLAFILPLWTGGEAADVLPFYIPSFAAIVLAFFSAPYFFRKSDNASYWYYLYLSKTALFFAILSSVIFCIGVTLCFGASAYLFSFKISGDVYVYTWFFGLFVMGPTYLLAHMPHEFDFEREDCHFPVGVYYIQKFILIPLALAITAMFYLYFLQILLLGEMPKGKIGWMVSGFSAVGVLTYMTIYPVYEKAGRLMAWFYRWFFVLMVIPTALLGWAIYVRINAYGVTVERHMLLAIFLAMVTWISMYFYQGRKFQLKHFISVVVLFLIIAAIGPLSAVNMSVQSQKRQLQTLLEKHGLFDDAGLYQNPQNMTYLPFEDEKRISSLVTFLNNYRAIAVLRPWFQEPDKFDTIFVGNQAGKNKKRKPHHHNANEKLINLMGLSYIHKYERAENQKINETGRRVQLTLKTSAPVGYDVMHSVSGFDLTSTFHMYLRNHVRASHKITYETEDGQWHHLTLSISDGLILVLKDEKDTIMARFDLSKIMLPDTVPQRLTLPRQTLYQMQTLTNGGTAAIQIGELAIRYRDDVITKVDRISAQLMLAYP